MSVSCQLRCANFARPKMSECYFLFIPPDIQRWVCQPLIRRATGMRSHCVMWTFAELTDLVCLVSWTLDLSERLWTSLNTQAPAVFESLRSAHLSAFSGPSHYIGVWTKWLSDAWNELNQSLAREQRQCFWANIIDNENQWQSVAISGNLSKSHRTSPLSSLDMPRRCPLSWCWLWTTWQDCAGYLRHWCQLMSASVFATLWAIPQTTYKDGMDVSWFGAAKGHRPQARMQRWFS